MNVYKKWAEILKANQGSKISYNHETEEFVITFPKHNGFLIPGDCVFEGEHIFKENSNTLICAVRRE